MIKGLLIEHYRSFRHLQIAGLGRVNLITGRNNSGKSTLLEALRILAYGASPSVLYDIMRFREEDRGHSQEVPSSLAGDSLFEFSSLFYGFPQFSPELAPIRVVAEEEDRRMALTIAMNTARRQKRDAEGTSLRLREHVQQPSLYSPEEVLPGLVIEADGVRRARSLDALRRYARRGVPQPATPTERRLPCSYVSAYGGEQTDTLSQLWDKIALSELEPEVVRALQLIDPQIEAVSTIGDPYYTRRRTAIVRHASMSRPVPLRSFGDGINRLFGIILSLVTAKDGLLLIDEFENGLHYSVQHGVWQTIFMLADTLNVQVIATSHSWDTVESFQHAAAEAPDKWRPSTATAQGRQDDRHGL